ncbi:MAG TPA: delta-60 repeat domain-containing protein, partial [Flavobacteriales bacterium]|nr:delta-60 repeat domain-containing protein [Flavobacteriales bacterium]
MKAHAIPLVAALVIATDATAQVPIIDYSFLALPPSVEVNSIVVQPDGRILMGGAFTNYAGSGKNNLVRLNSDGTVDPGWNPGGTGPGNAVEDIVLMPDGRIIIGGNFVEYNSEQVQFVARLMPSGL